MFELEKQQGRDWMTVSFTKMSPINAKMFVIVVGWTGNEENIHKIE